jgi:NAD(P)-dependent dehydrogenase (short-subunit alcohol dehydrogenase family)
MKRNIVCTGGNVGILNSTLHQIISRSTSDTPYKIIISSQSHYSTSALESLIPVQSNIQLIWLQLNLNDLNNVREFAKNVNNELNGESIDMLIINAAVYKTNGVVGKDDGWSEEARVNHFCQSLLFLIINVP